MPRTYASSRPRIRLSSVLSANVLLRTGIAKMAFFLARSDANCCFHSFAMRGASRLYLAEGLIAFFLDM